MELLDRIEAYLSKAHISASRFGRRAAGDPRLVLDLRAGRRLRRQTEYRLEAYLSTCEEELSGHHVPSKSPMPLPGARSSAKPSVVMARLRSG